MRKPQQAELKPVRSDDAAKPGMLRALGAKSKQALLSTEGVGRFQVKQRVENHGTWESWAAGSLVNTIYSHSVLLSSKSITLMVLIHAHEPNASFLAIYDPCLQRHIAKAYGTANAVRLVPTSHWHETSAESSCEPHLEDIRGPSFGGRSKVSCSRALTPI